MQHAISIYIYRKHKINTLINKLPKKIHCCLPTDKNVGKPTSNKPPETIARSRFNDLSIIIFKIRLNFNDCHNQFELYIDIGKFSLIDDTNVQ